MSQLQPREELKVKAERAVLVGVMLPGRDVDARDPLGELRALAQTAGAEVVGELVQNRSVPDGATYLGSGKVGELTTLINELGAKLAVFDNDLTPAQIRNLEKETSCKIVDRSELILDIFANRAATHEAKLQVEIAQLEYTYPRLRAMWDHLGQVTGGAPMGIGTRGPGEQQLEIDRRLVQRRLSHLRSLLKEIQARRTREVQNRNRSHFSVGLVGYTNAGKSTLFNRLTVGGGAFADPKLFATLSTRIERWELGGGNTALLSDTVGFVRDLPHHLVASFRSTLEETVHAQLLIIVVDASDPNAEAHLKTVRGTLDAIGASHQPRVLLLNKMDAVQDQELIDRLTAHEPQAFRVSANTGEGLEPLREFVLNEMVGAARDVEIAVPLADGRSVDFIEKRATVFSRDYTDNTAVLGVRIGRRQLEQLLALGARVKVNGVEGGQALRLLWGDSPLSDGDSMRSRMRPHDVFVGETKAGVNGVKRTS